LLSGDLDRQSAVERYYSADGRCFAVRIAMAKDDVVNCFWVDLRSVE